MKTLKLSVIAMVSLLFVSLSCKNDKKTDAEEYFNEEKTTVTQGEREIIFENDYAIVTNVTLKPGETQAEHDGANRVIYALTNYSLDWKEQGEDIGTKIWKDGEVHFHKSGKHSATNNGTTTAEWLVFSRKNTNLPKCGENTEEKDVNSIAPNFSKILFENDDFKVTQVNLPQGQSIPMHSGINRIIYSLSDYSLNYESDTKGKVDLQFKSGDAHWHDACQHALQNNGESEAKFLVVSYK